MKGNDIRADRWRARRWSAAFLRATIFVIPFVAGFVAGRSVANLLPEPVATWEIVKWWSLVIAAATVTATLVDRLARRLLPLSALLRMTMLFPDRAPSRMRVALRSGNTTELRRRILAAQSGGDTDAGEMSELILSLAAALSRHDRKTRGHSERTRAYTDIIAEEMGISEEDRDKLRWAALLHDVGKLEIPADVLNKEGRLTDEEWDIVRRHPVFGMKLVAPLIPWLGHWAQTIEHHHERWDGNGYPHGLVGTQICAGARIVAVGDAFDVMTSGRSYQRAKTPAAARSEIAAHSGRQFDPAVVRALMNVSLGRMRWATGPLAMLAELPFIRGLPEVGRDAATLLTSSAVMATAVATGVVIPAVDVSLQDLSHAVGVVLSGADFELPGIVLEPEPEVAAVPRSSSTPDTTDPVDDAAGDAVVAAGAPGTAEPPATTPTTQAPPTTSVAANSPPTVKGDTAGTSEDAAVTVDVLANDADPDGNLDAGSLVVVVKPAHGSASVTRSGIAYTPDTDYNGTDRFGYRVCDTDRACSEAEATVTVAPVNDAPVSLVSAATVNEDTLLTMALEVADVDGDRLTCTLAASPPKGAATVPADCSKLVYQPAANHNGTMPLSLTVSDGVETTAFTITVTIKPVNDPPTAGNDTASTRWTTPVDIPVIANDADPDGDQLTPQIVGQPKAGSATVVGQNIRYQPVFGVGGAITFTYKACDPAGACATATVTVQVAGLTVAEDDSATTMRDRGIEIQVMPNDTPGSGTWDKQPLYVIEQPDWGGTQVIGNNRIMYWPTRAWTGTDHFVYQVCDNVGSCDTATVTVVVQPR